MQTLEERGERAFARFWDLQPKWWIDGFVRMSMWIGPEEGEGSREWAAEEVVAYHLVREHVRAVWTEREAAKRRHKVRWQAALAGEVENDDAGEVQALAQAVEAGRVAEVLARVKDRWPMEHRLCFPAGGPSGAARYRAGVLLRNAGEAEGAYTAFGGCREEWYYARDGGFPIHQPLVSRSGWWRFGVPFFRHPSRWVGSRGYESVDLSGYDLVIGWKDVVNERVLTLLGGRPSRQVILGNGAPLPPSRGKVAIVDDYFDGLSSSCLAQVYNADVFDVGAFLDDGDSWEYPVCTVWNEQLAKVLPFRPQ